MSRYDAHLKLPAEDDDEDEDEEIADYSARKRNRRLKQKELRLAERSKHHLRRLLTCGSGSLLPTVEQRAAKKLLVFLREYYELAKLRHIKVNAYFERLLKA